MTTDLPAEIRTELGRLPGHPAVTALQDILDNGHIAMPDGLCVDCRWLYPCPTVVGVGISLGVISAADIASEGLRAQYERRQVTR